MPSLKIINVTLGCLQGVLKVNQLVEVRPGIVLKDRGGSIRCTPIHSSVVSLYAEQNELQFAVPVGLIGGRYNDEPNLDSCWWTQVLGAVGSLPGVFVELEVSSHLYSCLCHSSRKRSRKQDGDRFHLFFCVRLNSCWWQGCWGWGQEAKRNKRRWQNLQRVRSWCRAKGPGCSGDCS